MALIIVSSKAHNCFPLKVTHRQTSSREELYEQNCVPNVRRQAKPYSNTHGTDALRPRPRNLRSIVVLIRARASTLVSSPAQKPAATLTHTYLL